MAVSEPKYAWNSSFGDCSMLVRRAVSADNTLAGDGTTSSTVSIMDAMSNSSLDTRTRRTCNFYL